MKYFGNINLQNNEIQQATLQTEVGFPVNPTVGRIAFVDKVVWICADIQESVPIWLPLTNQQTTYMHVQDISSKNWVINHDLNSTFVIITCYDGNSKMIYPDEITINNASTVTVDFGATIAGKAVVITGSLEGAKPPVYSLEYQQTSPASTWIVNHNLGYAPIIRVFIGNNEVSPNSITFPNSNTVQIGFTSPQMGTVKLI
jgi:hypothetical protein